MSGFPTNGAGLSSETRIGLPIGIDPNNLLTGEFLARGADGELRRFAIPPTSTQPYLRGAAPMVPVSGSTMMLKQANQSNGTDTQSMTRFRVPITDDVHIFAPIWAGWGLFQSNEPVTGAALIAEQDTPNSVRVSASVETIDGRLYRLSAGGSRRWTVPSGGRVQSDPIDIDVKASDGYFWLRVYNEVDAGGFWWAGRNVDTVTTGQTIVTYANNLTLDFDTVLLATTPSLYWKLNALKGAVDQSGNSRNGTGQHGILIGGVSGVFGSNDATYFDGTGDVSGASSVRSTYNPFTVGQPFSFACLMNFTPAAVAQTIFGSDVTTNQPNLRIDANNTFTFRPDQNTGTTANWAVAPPTGWFHLALTHDDTTHVAELFLNGASQGTKTGLPSFNATPGNFDVGVIGINGNILTGTLERAAVWANHKLTGTEITNMYNAFLTGAADQTTGTGALLTLGSTSSGSGNSYGPVVLAGTINPNARKPIVGIWGDSIAEGRDDSPDATDGFASKACRTAGILSVKLAKGSERGVTETIGTRVARRLGLSDGITHAIYEHGVNDYRSANFPSLFVAMNTTLNCSRLAARGVKCFPTTLTPGATSSDSWMTIGNQTPHPDDLWRTQYNDWLRAGAPLASTTLTVASALTAGTLNVADTSVFPTSGHALIAGVPIHFTGKTSTTLTGCTAAVAPGSVAVSWPQPTSATIPIGTRVLCVPSWVSTPVGATQTLPLATINVTSTAGFANAGTAYFGSNGAIQAVAYTGTTSTTFTGCTGGTGNIGALACQQPLTVSAAALTSGQVGHPLAGFFDVADAVETSRNSGKWLVNGTANYATNDAIHPSGPLHLLMAGAIDTTRLTL